MVRNRTPGGVRGRGKKFPQPTRSDSGIKVTGSIAFSGAKNRDKVRSSRYHRRQIPGIAPDLRFLQSPDVVFDDGVDRQFSASGLSRASCVNEKLPSFGFLMKVILIIVTGTIRMTRHPEFPG